MSLREVKQSIPESQHLSYLYIIGRWSKKAFAAVNRMHKEETLSDLFSYNHCDICVLCETATNCGRKEMVNKSIHYSMFKMHQQKITQVFFS